MKDVARVGKYVIAWPFLFYCTLSGLWIGVAGVLVGIVVDALYWYSEGRLDLS